LFLRCLPSAGNIQHKKSQSHNGQADSEATAALDLLAG
jgi:hypothetical protein